MTTLMTGKINKSILFQLLQLRRNIPFGIVNSFDQFLDFYLHFVERTMFYSLFML